MKQKMVLAIAVVILVCMALAMILLNRATVPNSIITVYVENSYAFYIMEDGEVEVVYGTVKAVTTEDEVSWKKIIDRKSYKPDPDFFQQIMMLVDVLDSGQGQITQNTATFATPAIGLWYNGKHYKMLYHDPIASEGTSSMGQQKKLEAMVSFKSIVDILINTSPILVEVGA